MLSEVHVYFVKLVNKLLIKEIQVDTVENIAIISMGIPHEKYCISMILKHYNSMYYNSLYAY